jgi:hypothetical protein
MNPPVILFVQVMDNEPTLLAVWGAALVLGLVGFAATRFRRWLVLPALGAIGFVAWSQLGQLTDPVVGQAIIQKAGQGYLVQACAAVALAVVLAVVGLVPKRGV